MTAVAAEFADCELRDDWFFAQDVNAWSSLGYVVVGVAVVVAVGRGRLPAAFAVLGVLTAVEGIGSVAYHGSSGDVARAVHDLALVGLLAFVAGWQVGRLGSRTERTALATTVVGLALGGVAWAVAPESTNVMVAVAVAVVVVAEVVARRRGAPVVWSRGLLVTVGVAVLAWLAGTPGSPLCDAASLLQPHALWHLLTAVVVGWWAARAGRVSTSAR